MFGMTNDQITGMLRQVLPIIGTLAAALGWIAPEKVAPLTATILAISGPVIALGSILWMLVANSKSSIIASAAAMPEVKGIITTATPAGNAMAAAVPATNVVSSGTNSAATIASSATGL